MKLQQAAEVLGVTSSALCVSGKYKDFYTKSPKGTRDAYFDMVGYLRKEDIKTALVAQVSLFTEYLNKIEGFTYQRIADVGKVSFQTVNSCSMGYKTSLQAAVRFRCKFHKEWKAYHEFYNYKGA